MPLTAKMKSRSIAALAAAGLVLPMLAGCSSRDRAESEKVAAINAAAVRAEAAADRAENAAAKLRAARAPTPVVTQEAEEPAPDEAPDQPAENTVQNDT